MMLGTQIPVFLTEPPQLKPSPRRKDGKRRHLVSMTLASDSERVSLPPITGGTSTDMVRASEEQEKPGMLAAVRAGLRKAYLDGIEYLRTKVNETERELETIKREFYQCGDGYVLEESTCHQYIVKANEWFLKANNELRRKNVKLDVIDGEVRLVSYLNQLRDHCDYDKGQIAFITEFWENIKNSLDSLKILVDKFKTNVLERLRKNCTSYNSAEIHLDVSARYTEEISDYLADIERVMKDTQILMKSFGSGIHQDLYTHTKLTEGLLVSCDLKAFPILRLFPDLTEKIESMCAIALLWLSRDETYMYEVNDYIRETRTMTKKRVEDLKSQREKQKRIEKAVKAANILLSNNKEKLQKLEGDLNQLENSFDVYQRKKKSKFVEKQQKESMVDFLKITESQTKRNYNLQMKRQKLLRQVHELEDFLSGLERDLTEVQERIVEKEQEKEFLSEKVGSGEKSYVDLKTNLERFTHNLDELEQEVNGLSVQLLQLEIIQTYKTSPEQLDQLYDRPQSVKLAPSLKEKIKKKRKGVVAQVH